jgi:hypothetical protein
VNKFSKLVHQSCWTLTAWRTGKYTIQLPRILLFCYQFGITPSRLLFDRFYDAHDIHIASCPEDIVRQVVRPLRKHNAVRLGTQLEKIVRSNKYPPLSMRSVARQLNCDASQIGRMFPQQAKVIICRHSAFIKQNKAQRHSRIKETLRTTILSLHSAGTFPSQRRVRLKLGACILRERWVREEYKKIMAELGLLKFEIEH